MIRIHTVIMKVAVAMFSDFKTVFNFKIQI